MSILGTYHEIEELGGGRFRLEQHLRPICYRGDDGYMRRISQNWVDGDAARPHLITQALLMVSIAPDGGRRLHPTREIDRYVELGAPYIKPGGSWQKVNLGQATRLGNQLSWQTAQADVNLTFGGHYLKLEIPLKNGWQPPGGQLAFPVGLNGLTRQGGMILADGVGVMRVQTPVVYDAGNPEDRREIAVGYIRVGQQWYAVFTLPGLAGMNAPVIDPTLTLQPDATAGKDDRVASGGPTNNNGVSIELITASSARKGLIEFDLSSIDATATCTASTLYLYQVNSGAASAFTLTIYSIASGNAAWIEGTKNGTQAGAGEPCWNALAADGAGGVTTAWAGSAGLATSGTDYEASSIGSSSGNKSDANGTEYSTALTTSRVQGWFGASNTNYGMLVTTSADPGGMGSSDNATSGRRPKLITDYTLPGKPTHFMFYQRMRK